MCVSFLSRFPIKVLTFSLCSIDDGDQLADNTRDPSTRMSFVTVSADGVIRWFVSTERMILASSVWTRAPSFSTAEHKIKAFDAVITHADTFFITRTTLTLVLCVSMARPPHTFAAQIPRLNYSSAKLLLLAVQVFVFICLSWPPESAQIGPRHVRLQRDLQMFQPR
jgi:hypothetical protein